MLKQIHMDHLPNGNPVHIPERIDLFETLLGRKVQDQGIDLKRFVQMNQEELSHLRFPRKPLETDAGFYRYIRDNDDIADDKIRLIHFPFGSVTHKNSILAFWTFSATQFADPQFNLPSSPSLSGTLTFDQASFEEFIILLKRMAELHNYPGE